ncbi:restriction endonuclease subunit S, partial [Globicatella sulfidifaciens]
AESDRYGWFISDSSIRASLDLPRFYEITIPLPNLEQQKSIVEIYNSYIIRKEIAVLLKNKIKSICPVLIKGSVEEAKEYEKV